METTLKIVAVCFIACVTFIAYGFAQLYKEEKWRQDNNCVILSNVLVLRDSYFPYRNTYKTTMDCNGKEYYYVHH